MRLPRALAGLLVLALALAVTLLLALGPREPADLVTPAVVLPDDLSGWLATREAGIAPDEAARIDWAGRPGQATDLALIYVHGFSGSPTELDPLPRQVAASLGANLYSLRLTGHGGDDAGMIHARLADWWRDMAEAVEIGRRLGRNVVLIGLSTGATLATEAALDGELGPDIAGLVLISPNFAVRNRLAWMMDLPHARSLARYLDSRRGCRGLEAVSSAAEAAACHATEAALPVAALLRHARSSDVAKARQPALFIWSDEDRIVRPGAIRRVADLWGGPVTRLPVRPGPRDHIAAHVIAGDAFSPYLSRMLTPKVAEWIAALGATAVEGMPASPDRPRPAAGP